MVQLETAASQGNRCSLVFSLFVQTNHEPRLTVCHSKSFQSFDQVNTHARVHASRRTQIATISWRKNKTEYHWRFTLVEQRLLSTDHRVQVWVPMRAYRPVYGSLQVSKSVSLFAMLDQIALRISSNLTIEAMMSWSWKRFSSSSSPSKSILWDVISSKRVPMFSSDNNSSTSAWTPIFAGSLGCGRRSILL